MNLLFTFAKCYLKHKKDIDIVAPLQYLIADVIQGNELQGIDQCYLPPTSIPFRVSFIKTKERIE